MRNDERQVGFTLVEMLIVVAIGVMLMAIALPAYHAMTDGAKMAQTNNVIAAALGTARTYAIKKQKYAGVRFQFDRGGWREGKQYAILIEHNTDLKVSGSPATWSPYVLEHRYTVVPNTKPLVLPQGMGILGMKLDIDASGTTDDFDLDEEGELADATGFAIVFTPSGRLTVKESQCLPRRLPNDPPVLDYNEYITRNDKVFCPPDEMPPRGLPLARDEPICVWDGPNNEQVVEKSQTGLYVFEVDKMGGVDRDYRYTDYVERLDPPILLNAFTGMVIDE